MRCRPHEASFVQTANAQPDTVFVPAQHLNARAGLVGEDEGSTFVPRGFKLVLDIPGQRIDPASHIHRFDREENVLRRQHV